MYTVDNNSDADTGHECTHSDTQSYQCGADHYVADAQADDATGGSTLTRLGGKCYKD
jgi:hypothetical protein